MKTKFKVTGWNRSVFEGEKFNTSVREVQYDDCEAETDELIYRFRCCDDDGITYFWGTCNNDSSFAPLDCLGASYGCTYIEYKNPKTGEYEML